MVIPAETCEAGLGAARPFTIDTADEYITADTPEVVIGQGITTSQEATTSFPHINIQTAPVHSDPIPPVHNIERSQASKRVTTSLLCPASPP